MPGDAELDRLLAEVDAHPLGGWDFGWLGPRMRSAPLPWDFDAIVARHARASIDLLDLGTGGGEWLAALEHRPPRTVATEPWKPNVEIAGARLRPLGVIVVAVEAAPDNADQRPGDARGRLPFPAASFELVVSRHESFAPAEVARVLAPGGRFVTQQVGDGRYDRLRRDLGLQPQPPARVAWTLELARAQLEAAGLQIGAYGEGDLMTSFADVGALAWFLKAAPWVVPEFSLRLHREALGLLHGRIAREGPYTVVEPSFYVEAIRDPAP